jgi:hypothetical protein
VFSVMHDLPLDTPRLTDTIPPLILIWRVFRALSTSIQLPRI